MVSSSQTLSVSAAENQMNSQGKPTQRTNDFFVRHGTSVQTQGPFSNISFMTIHGKSRYPGLYVWTRDWTKRAVKIPEGCLLIQAGTSFEHITGGYVLAGFHEVVYTEATKEAFRKRAEQFEAQGINRR